MSYFLMKSFSCIASLLRCYIRTISIIRSTFRFTPSQSRYKTMPSAFFPSDGSRASRTSRSSKTSKKQASVVVDPLPAMPSSNNSPIEGIVAEERFPERSPAPPSEPSPSLCNYRDNSEYSISENSVGAKSPTKLFTFVTKRNWAGAVKRCNSADGKKEAATWIVENNQDGTVRWRLLPIHQVSYYVPLTHSLS